MTDSTQQQPVLTDRSRGGERTGAILVALVALVLVGLIIWSTSYHLARYECEQALGGNYIVGKCRS